MIEQLSPIPWSEEYSDEDEMIDFVVAASEMLEELLARPHRSKRGAAKLSLN
jgi:hypothetical protein